MKKYFLSLVAIAAAMLFATSCQESLVEPQLAGPTTFTVQVPDQMGTKAGEDSYQLFVEVYSAEGDESYHRNDEPIVMAVGTPTTVTLNLVANQAYDIIFWAQKNANSYGVSDLSTVQMNENHHNSETGAAFYAVLNNYNPTQGKQDVKLTRPFAQLNFYTNNNVSYGSVQVLRSTIKVTNVATSFNRVADKTYGEGVTTGTYTYTSRDTEDTNRDLPVGDPKNIDGVSYQYVSMDYLAVPGNEALVDIEATFFVKDSKDVESEIKRTFEGIPVQMNYRTNIIGNLITSASDFKVEISEDWAGGYDIENGYVSTEVDSAEELKDAFDNESVDEIVLGGDINLNDLFNQTKSEVTTEDPTLTIAAGKTLTIDLNGNTLSATSSQTGKNYNMFDVRGTLTVKNGTMEYEHKGENMGWGASTNLFNVTAGGVLNLEGVTATNLGGSDMGFVVHLNNWGEVTLNAENCTLVSNYVPVRVFNSGYDMNNVTIKNSTLTGGSASFWVHNYTKEDFGSQEKADSQKELLKLNIYNQGNTFSPDLNGIRYGFTNSIRTDACGIYKRVSEDGTEVTLGSLIENGLVRRGVAGTEENTTIKKVVVEEGITTLYDRTFRRFYALEEVVLPEGLTTIGEAGSGVFQSCTALKNIVIPESVTVLGKGTFQECSSLESINIPSRVTRIEENCLRATGLVSVEFHAGVTYFGAQAFRDCKQLKEVIITAPEFTIEANAFGVMAGTLPGITIYVANTAMQEYLESTLAYKNQFTIEVIGVSDVTSLDSKLNAGGYVILTEDLTFSATETVANSGYGATGVKVAGDAVLDGQGHTLTVNGAWNTWDCAIAATGGTIKNLTVSGAMRGIFMPGADGDVYINNVIFDNVIYTFNSDAGNKNYGVYISNSTLNGWTSHSDVHKEVVYTNCKFGKGNGYAFCRPYGPTSFVGCDFEAGFEVDAIGKITFENCTIGGVALTAENLATLVKGGIANATVK